MKTDPRTGSPPPAIAPQRARTLAPTVSWGGLIAVALLIVYGPALRGELLWDDLGHLTRTDLRSLAGLGRIWFELGATQQCYPVLHTAFWLEHQLWGDAVLGYHVTNVLQHALAAVLFIVLLRRLQVPGARFAGLVFAFHPVAVESVAWISEQKNTLSLLLALAAAYLYIRFDEDRRPGRYAWATAVFVLALLTKTVTATLPAALLVVLWWKRGRLDLKRDVAWLAPWLVTGAAAALLTAWVERTLIGAQGAEFDLGFVERLLIAGRVPWFYLGKLCWPYPLIFIYPRWTIDPSAAGPYFFPALTALVLAGLVAAAVRRGHRGPLAVALLFGGMLVPVLGFLNVYPFLYSFVADHFQYHAALAVFAGVGALGARAFARSPHPVLMRTAAAGLVLGLAFLSWRQSHLYRDVFALYETTLARNPRAWMAHTNLGIALVDAGRATEAVPHYREALRLRPRYAEGENNLGFALSELGRPAEAVPHLRRALALKPDYLQARNNLAVALLASGAPEEGLALFRETIALYPQNGDAHFNYGLALARLGQAEAALASFERAVAIAPDRAEYVLHVGLALFFNRQPEAAMPHFQRAIELAPQVAANRYAFGQVLLQLRRHTEAIAQFREVLRLDPQFTEAHAGLATALAAVGDEAGAAFHRREAQRLTSGANP